MLVFAFTFLALGLDTLAAAVGQSFRGASRAAWLKIALVFALFEAGMPAVGLIAGEHLSGEIARFSGGAGGAILLILGVMGIRDGLLEREADEEDVASRNEEVGEEEQKERSSGRRSCLRLVATGVSISLDELAVGFSLGILHAPLALTLGYLGCQAFVFTLLGLFLGERVGKKLGDRAEIAAGILLALVGLAVLIESARGRS